MTQSELYRKRREIDRIHDLVGADVPRDAIKTIVEEQTTNVVVELATTANNTVRVEDTSGNGVDPATESTLAAIAAAVNASDILEVEQQTPVGVEDSTGSQVDPVDQSQASAVTASDSGTGSGSAASLTLGPLRQAVDIHVDTSGAATLTVEVSPDGGTTWLQFDTVSYSEASVEVEQYETAFADVRAYLDQNRNGVTVASKGVA